jgi:serine protease Do
MERSPQSTRTAGNDRLRHGMAGLLALFSVLVTACNRPGASSRAQPSATAEIVPAAPVAPALPAAALDIPALVAKVKPVVVNVTVAQAVRAPRRGADWPFDLFPWPPFGERRREQGPDTDVQRRVGRGSGFIIDAAGHVVTNAHVVEGADVVRVRLLDERELDAKVEGRDRHLDVAVLELQGAKDLPVAVLGSSDATAVGEPVIAIGNPFALGHTVTQGIVSAKGRSLGTGPYDDFLQTDAAINPGNSGGPLFNVRGEVIGINTAIAAQGSGIGFAIAIDEVKSVLPQLIEKGRVERGRLGVVVQAVDWPMARALGLDRPRGALVAQVEAGSPAGKAGLAAGDIVVSAGGRQIEHWQELPRSIARTTPGSRLSLEVIRDGKTRTFEVTVGRLEDQRAAGPSAEPEERASALGVQVEDAPGGGALVRRVLPGGAAEAVLQAGDVVLEVDRAPVKSTRDFERLVRAAPAGSPLLLRIRREGRTLFAAIEAP